MYWQPTVLGLAAILGGIFAAAVAGQQWRRRSRPAAKELIGSMVGHSVWMLAQGLTLWSVPLWLKQFWFAVSIAGIHLAATGWLFFALAYTGRTKWITRRWIALAFAIPVLALPFWFLNGGGLTFVDLGLENGRLVYEWGPLAWIEFAHVAVTGSLGVGLHVSKFVHSKNYYRRSSFFAAVTSAIATACFVASAVGVSPLPHFVLWPATFLILGVVSVGVMARSQVLNHLPLDRVFALVGARYKDTVPVARDLVVEELGSGVIVLDSKNRVADINPTGRRMLAMEGDRVVGRRIETVVDTEASLTDDLAFLDPDVSRGSFEGIWVQADDESRRCYDIVVTDLSEKRPDLSGRVGLIHDVTRQQEREQTLEKRTHELERQNERLEEFTSIVSHDLRNPLNTAQGFVDLAEQTGTPDHFDAIRESHDRMQAIIDDVLTIAREGRTVNEPEPVEIATLAHRAWGTVETTDATIAVETTDVVEADPDRLRRLFENLIRNAVEHGGPTVTVRIGPLEDGFYVEDDGPGIPEADREQVLDRGYTTSDEGTGFGLAIVDTLSEAHGWTVTITEGDDGGARFEFTGCQIQKSKAIDA